MKTTYKIRIENHFAGRAHGKLYEGEFIMWEVTCERHIAPNVIVETLVGEGSADTEEEALAQAQERIETLKER